MDWKDCFSFSAKSSDDIGLRIFDPKSWSNTVSGLDDKIQKQAQSEHFTGKSGSVLRQYNALGQLNEIWLGIELPQIQLSLGQAMAILPPQNYHIKKIYNDIEIKELQFFWGLCSYSYDYYRQNLQKKERPKLRLTAEHGDVAARLRAAYLARDMINAPAEYLGPVRFQSLFEEVAQEFGAKFNAIVGDQLVQENFPLIHAVGRASDEEPRLLEFRWGQRSDPLVTLVGKGVCFDTGGLNMKSSGNMRLMKKDMGGAAHILALALIVMSLNLNVRLHVLLPVVENNVGGAAFRPSDVLVARNGTSVEIDNTDAEGRLILADALSYACEDPDNEPELLIDMATLTGAARTALGPEVMPFYCDSNDLAASLYACGVREKDPLWRMPLWQSYHSLIGSPVADIANAGSNFAGSITAALFLQKFVSCENWCHFDIYAWNPFEKPGRPAGAETQAIWAVSSYLENEFGKSKSP